MGGPIAAPRTSPLPKRRERRPRVGQALSVVQAGAGRRAVYLRLRAAFLFAFSFLRRSSIFLRSSLFTVFGGGA